jgi:hypothetical protein
MGWSCLESGYAEQSDQHAGRHGQLEPITVTHKSDFPLDAGITHEMLFIDGVQKGGVRNSPAFSLTLSTGNLH